MWCRRGWIVILLANVLPYGCSHSTGQAQGGTAKPVPSSGALKVKDNKPPRLVVDRATFDFEKMDQHTKESHIFQIHNEGEGVLLLRIQHTSCGCTSVKLGTVEWDPANPAPKTLVTLSTGEKIDVEMTWDTKER